MLAVTGHGIPQETIDNLVAAMESYFSLPLETKMKVTWVLDQFVDFYLTYESSIIKKSDPISKDTTPVGFQRGPCQHGRYPRELLHARF